MLPNPRLVANSSDDPAANVSNEWGGGPKEKVRWKG